MKFKKFILGISTISLVTTPVATIISCNSKSFEAKDLDYDVGYALEDITSLNYIKYKSSVKFSNSVVETFAKSSPQKKTALANYLDKFPQVYYKISDHFNPRLLSDISRTSGVLKSQQFKTKKVEFPAMSSKDSQSDTFVLRLNGKSKWSNGKKLTPSDFIDAFVYVLDLNTGSQLLNNFLNINIKNAREFVATQMKYSKKYSKLYKNPFGYIKNHNYSKEYEVEDRRPSYYVQTKYEFPLQIYTKTTDEIKKMDRATKINYLKKQQNEREIVDKIEFFAKNLGVYADLNSSHPYTNVIDKNGEKLTSDIKTSALYKFNDDNSYIQNGETIYPNVLQIVTSYKQDLYAFFIHKFIHTYWIPINRQFVESIGGIEKFGLSSQKFLTQGPFKIASITLGFGGSIILEKNKNYWDARNTIPNKVKIFFQTDPIILFSYFEDRYISWTNLNGISTQKLYASKEYRDLLKKHSGVGSTAIVFNLDKNSPGYNKILADPNLRKALFYTIDRGEIIKLSGYDSTIPIYSFIDGSFGTQSKWLGNEQGAANMIQKIGNSIYFDKYKPSEPKKMFPYKISSYISKESIIGNFNQTDVFKNKELALRYFSEFLKNNPGNHKITFIHDSTKQILQIGIAIQSAVKKFFGNRLKIEIKGYPKSIYDSFYSSGNFEFTYRNLDHLVTKSGGTHAFYQTDEINKKDQKNIGFSNNPTGAWTFNEIVKNKVDNISSREKELKDRLGISDIIWDKIFELSTIPQMIREKPKEDQNVFIIERLNSFFDVSNFEFDGLIYPIDENFKNSERIVELAKVSNKLLMEYSPIIPLFIVDNTYYISRLVNYKMELAKVSFDYAYDYRRKPINNLPGKEAMVG